MSATEARSDERTRKTRTAPETKILENARFTGGPEGPEGPDDFERGLGGSRKEEFEERAAIMEFDGGLTRAEAERAARAITGFGGW